MWKCPLFGAYKHYLVIQSIDVVLSQHGPQSSHIALLAPIKDGLVLIRNHLLIIHQGANSMTTPTLRFPSHTPTSLLQESRVSPLRCEVGHQCHILTHGL